MAGDAVDPTHPGEVSAWATDILGPAWSDGTTWKAVSVFDVDSAFEQAGAPDDAPISLEVEFDPGLWDRLTEDVRRVALLHYPTSTLIGGPQTTNQTLPWVLDLIPGDWRARGGKFVVVSDKEMPVSIRAHSKGWQPKGPNLTPLGAGIGAFAGIIVVVAVAIVLAKEA